MPVGCPGSLALVTLMRRATRRAQLGLGVGPPFMNRRTRQLMSESVLMRASAGLWARSIGLDRHHLRVWRRDQLDLESGLAAVPLPAAARRGTPERRSGRCAVQIRHVALVRPALQVEAVVGLHKGARDLLAWRLANALDLNGHGRA
jgi:hypothetical protein